MDQNYFRLLCIALITLVGLGRLAETQPAADNQQQNEALERLFLAIDTDGDGIIKMNDLDNLEGKEQFMQLVPQQERRTNLINLLKNACGINIDTFKALFQEHFRIPEVRRPEGPGAIEILVGVIGRMIQSLGNQVAQVAVQARTVL
ncbi:hypothetical protein LSTR_LSTR013946 [Laodelphax striatellus]|uniref:EF-hand domain-containing protein n=1 Tax=Laodelphax striatellus TaxID=195883 RepID=A0A482XY27_LAOST|nr:hypothetical protein LSTR_LSTR013946 [Laodelphax striatellus]